MKKSVKCKVWLEKINIFSSSCKLIFGRNCKLYTFFVVTYCKLDYYVIFTLHKTLHYFTQNFTLIN